MTWAFTPSPHVRELMEQAAMSPAFQKLRDHMIYGTDTPHEIIVKKGSAVGWTETQFSDEVLAGFRAEAKRLMAEGPRPQRLSAAIKKINQENL